MIAHAVLLKRYDGAVWMTIYMGKDKLFHRILKFKDKLFHRILKFQTTKERNRDLTKIIQFRCLELAQISEPLTCTCH